MKPKSNYTKKGFGKKVKDFKTKVYQIYGLYKKNKFSLNECRDSIKKEFDNIAYAGYNLEQALSDEKIIKKIKKNFRGVLEGLLFRSKFGKRAQSKPRGYPGDYKMIEFMYNNKPTSIGIGRFLDFYILENPYVVAVRNRKDKMRGIIEKFISTSSKSCPRILNFGSGGCREIREISSQLMRVAIQKKIIFNFVDQDNKALNFSNKKIYEKFNELTPFRFHNENILNILIHKKDFLKLIGKQDLIYSIGVTDYLPDSILKSLFSLCLDLLSKNGTIVFAHKDRDSYNPAPIDWFCDWRFYPRNEKYVIRLMKKVGSHKFNIKTDREPSGNIMFFTITKK